eukprot:347521-Chlamydomonas_euryale.AAC.2
MHVTTVHVPNKRPNASVTARRVGRSRAWLIGCSAGTDMPGCAGRNAAQVGNAECLLCRTEAGVGFVNGDT